MTIYHINLGIGWASSGVEYAQAYRAKCLRQLGIKSKFIFTDFISQDNIADLTRNLGFLDEEIIWLYLAFTDQKIAPSSFSLTDLLAQYDGQITRKEMQGKIVRLFDDQQEQFLTAYLIDENKPFVHRVEYVSRGCLIRKDFYSYTKMFTEFYYPNKQIAQLYQRTFYHEDGSVAYDELISGQEHYYRFADRLLLSKEDLMVYFMQSLNLTSSDVVLLDRSTGIGQAVFRQVKPAKLGVVVHAEHFSPSHWSDGQLLWNNHYEYQLTNRKQVDFFILATERQKAVLKEQLLALGQSLPKLITIPVGSLPHLSYPKEERLAYHVLTVSRLATEKHIDWLIEAVIMAKKDLPKLTFDIYGFGGEGAKLTALIRQHQAETYIRLLGHQEMSTVYPNYQLYLTASTSEGFGLTLMEAVGAGLPLIGLDVPYGNQTFIQDGKNGYLLPKIEGQTQEELIATYASALVTFFKKADQKAYQDYSYQLAKSYLDDQVRQQWADLVKEMGEE